MHAYPLASTHGQPGLSPITRGSLLGRDGQLGPIASIGSTTPAPSKGLDLSITSTGAGSRAQTRAGTRLPSGRCRTAEVKGPGVRKCDPHLFQMPPLLLPRNGDRDPLVSPNEPRCSPLLLAQVRPWIQEGAFPGGRGHCWPSRDTQDRLQRRSGQLWPLIRKVHEGRQEQL